MEKIITYLLWLFNWENPKSDWNVAIACLVLAALILIITIWL